MTSRTVEWLRGVAVGGLLQVSVTAKPVPASRPRFNRATGAAYHTKNYQEFQNECRKGFSSSRFESNWPQGPLEGPIAVAVVVRSERPKSTKLSAPRGDVDNFVKGPLDAATKCDLWGDDSQVELLAAEKRWCQEGEEPGVELFVARLA